MPMIEWSLNSSVQASAVKCVWYAKYARESISAELCGGLGTFVSMIL
jgi:hypothetical protein